MSSAPYETAMLIDDYLRSKGLREKSDIEVFTPEPLPMPVAGPDIGNAVVAMLNEKRINFYNNTKISLIDGKAKEILFENGAREKYDLLIAIPPHTSPRVARESDLADARPDGFP